MYGQIEWADADNLVFSNTFLITKSLWDLESYLYTFPSGDRFSKPTVRDSLHWSRRFEYPWVLRRIDPQPDDIVIDAGAGSAILQFTLSRCIKELHNLDIDEPELDRVNRLKKESGHFNNIITTLGDIRAIPYADDYFTKSVCISVLEHLPPDDVRKGLDELVRVTKNKIFITIDVCLTTIDTTIPSNIITIKQFTDMCNDLNIIVPDLPKSVMAGTVDNNYIVVACMEIWK